MTHDYKRNGTNTFAAMSTFDGTVISRCAPRHRHVEWLTFLRQINRETPKDKSFHLICDNHCTHKHPKVTQWLAKRLRNGVFRSVPELTTAIKEYIEVHNKNPKPFVWTAKANDIRANSRLNSKQNEALH